jgi:L-idonate 5-dehydrogenase
MKACVIHGAGQLRIEDRDEPQPAAHEVVVRLGAGGICGSDLHYFAEGGVGDFRLREPMILGHEGAGEVVRVGPSVTAVKPGDRVAVNPNHPCGNCGPCQAGRRNLCRNVRFFGSAARFPHVQGLFAENFIAREENCHVLPEGFSFRVAACAEPLAVALHAVERAGPVLGRSVFIAGSGPIGVLIAAAARLAGASRICVTDLFDAPLAIARAMGATETINIKADAPALEALVGSGGIFEVVFEASGYPSGLATAIEVAAPGATLVQVGMLPRGNTAAPLNRIIARELNLVGTFRFGPEYAWAVRALVSGQVDVSPMLTHQFGFDEVDAAFAMAADKNRAMKVSLLGPRTEDWGLRT